MTPACGARLVSTDRPVLSEHTDGDVSVRRGSSRSVRRAWFHLVVLLTAGSSQSGRASWRTREAELSVA